MDILVVPDVKAMDRAIEQHLGTCPIIKRANTVNEKNKCLDYLIEQILDVAALEDRQEKEQRIKRTLLRGNAPPTHKY
jgi:hypothetical protein